MSFDRQKYLEKCASQRAALMAVVSNIINMPDDKSLTNAKTMIAGCFSKMIDNDVMVCDSIDSQLLHEIKSFLEQESAIEAVSNIINPDKPL